MPSPRFSILFVVLAGVLFGTAGTAQALGPAGTTPMAVGILRIQVGAIALLAAMPLIRRSPRSLLRLWRTPAMLGSALGAAVYQTMFFGGVERAGVALGTLVAVGSEPVFAGILGWIAMRHRPTRGWLVVTAVSLVGLGLRSAGSGLGEPGSEVGLGLLMALGAGLCIALYNVAAKVQLERGVTTLEVTSGSFVLGGLLLLPLLVREPLGWVTQPDGLLLVLYLGIATMAVANLLLTRGIHGLKPGPTATLMLTDPVVATVLGILVLGETLSPVAGVGVLLVLAGLVAQGVLEARATPDQEDPIPVL
jgi:drug/metabolite transporter, DME family